MPTTEPRLPLDEICRLGEEMFNRKVRQLLRPEDHGKFVAINVVTGDYEIDEDDYKAATRLRSRVPSDNNWLMRVGYPTAYSIRRAR